MKKACLLFIILFSQIIISAHNKFSLITTLYNETHEERINEFITCIDINLANDCIDEIHIIYDISKDDSENKLLALLQKRPVHIHTFSGRPSYGFCFNFAKDKCKNTRIIIANGDIYFNNTLHSLDSYDLHMKFLALTRWNVSDKGACSLHRDEGSQDAWIFQSPLPQFINDSMQMGIAGCDNAIAYRAAQAGLMVLNPCHSIQSFHLGSSNIRTWKPNITVPGPYMLVKHATL
jgi:hypothetical protein